MKGAKVHPLILVALFTSSLLMAIYAYWNFQAEASGYGIVFTLLGLFMLGLVLAGAVMKRKNRTQRS